MARKAVQVANDEPELAVRLSGFTGQSDILLDPSCESDERLPIWGKRSTRRRTGIRRCGRHVGQIIGPPSRLSLQYTFQLCLCQALHGVEDAVHRPDG